MQSTCRGSNFRTKIWFERSFNWKSNFNPWAKSFWTFWWHLFWGLFELIFKCPEDHIEEKKVLNRIFSWLTISGVWEKKICISDSNLPSGLSKLNSMCQWIFFHETKDFEKNTYYHNHFRFLDGNFPSLSQEISQKFISSAFNLSGEIFRENRLWETNSFSLFFFKNFLLFSLFCEFTQIFLGSVLRTELYVSTGLSSWEVFSLKKKFQIVFQFVGQSFSGLWQNVFCTVVRTAFFVSSGTFHGEKFFEKPCLLTWGSSVKLSRNSK